MKLFQKWHLDRQAFAGAIRTAGALLLGNSLVVPVLRDFKDSYWWVLAIAGIAGIILTSFTERKPS